MVYGVLTFLRPLLNEPVDKGRIHHIGFHIGCPYVLMNKTIARGKIYIFKMNEINTAALIESPNCFYRHVIMFTCLMQIQVLRKRVVFLGLYNLKGRESHFSVNSPK